MDAPARWIDPLPEDWLLRRLAPTSATPDHVTLVGVALGTLAAWLLWHGWLGAALPAMLVVGWLDGVDGKLARLKLQYSRLGEAEALLDFAVENAWWIALTAFQARGHGAAALLVGAALLGGNLADEIAYTIGHSRLGRALDLLSPADRTFRLVAGRRNIYVWILCVAALAGSSWHGFVACGLWALATASVHGVRLARALRGAARLLP
jgi:phosphatidylglycerophosphate synthase